MKTCYLVTGSIKPDFHYLVFTNKKAANKYKAAIKRYSKQNGIMPAYKPVIESRDCYDMKFAGNRLLAESPVK